METPTTNIDSNLVKSKSYFENNPIANTNVSTFAAKKVTNKKNDEQNSDEILTIVEDSLFKANLKKFSNEITHDLKDFDFEAGLQPNEIKNYQTLRKRNHALIVAACANAAYFVGVANRIRRNIDDIKKGITKQKNNSLLNEIIKIPGLQVGIIGCGKLGRQLATALINYGDVYPNELQLSTRQPETLTQFKNLNIRCSFNNARVASSVNILFLCVLPSQLNSVVDEIKTVLPDRIIIYSFVRTQNELHLKNLLSSLPCSRFILKPDFVLNSKLDDMKINWNYTLGINESLRTKNMTMLVNSMAKKGLIFENSELNKLIPVYSLLNICTFLGLSKTQVLSAMRSFLFSSSPAVADNFKLEESHFFDKNCSELNFPIVDQVGLGSINTPLLERYKNSKTFSALLAKNFVEYFEEAAKYCDRFKL